ncbi:metalloregulator ArsR/SmtB family transcription factor [Thermoanaerobacterium sp. RBIITD]|uniref:ArsR/SmtB family transcription factor n=1 Tax=Thermoanaerobacterium sp. RBIITD TaxID=1550240 RepID=UPI000BC07740|nr:metalloregulator ArsR/SmtB family transcription factor [Thermoanaerobacterium sp. RBIITD]SNX53969.1 ArsR family transcriptional regulator [Thermoanaerobacterium sp. RBIITD]
MKGNITDDSIIDKIALFGKALSDPKRIEMLKMFAENKRCFEKSDGTKVENKEETPDGICVCHFVNEFDMAQSKVSYHIKILKDAGIIKETVVGKWRYYDIDFEKFNEILDLIKNVFT